jgi:hypothetical protein
MGLQSQSEPVIARENGPRLTASTPPGLAVPVLLRAWSAGELDRATARQALASIINERAGRVSVLEKAVARGFRGREVQELEMATDVLESLITGEHGRPDPVTLRRKR